MNRALDTAHTMHALQRMLEGDAALPVRGLGRVAFAECVLALQKEHASHFGLRRHTEIDDDDDGDDGGGGDGGGGGGGGGGDGSMPSSPLPSPTTLDPPPTFPPAPAADGGAAEAAAPAAMDRGDAAAAAAAAAEGGAADDAVAGGLSAPRPSIVRAINAEEEEGPSSSRRSRSVTIVTEEDGSTAAIGPLRVVHSLQQQQRHEEQQRRRSKARGAGLDWGLGRLVRRAVVSRRFELCIDVLVLLSVVVLIVEIELFARDLREPVHALDHATALLFDACFLLEVGLTQTLNLTLTLPLTLTRTLTRTLTQVAAKGWGHGWARFVRRKSDVYALAVACLTSIADITEVSYRGANLHLLRVAFGCRLLRLPRLVFSLNKSNLFFIYLLRSLPSFFGLLGLIWVLFGATHRAQTPPCARSAVRRAPPTSRHCACAAGALLALRAARHRPLRRQDPPRRVVGRPCRRALAGE